MANLRSDGWIKGAAEDVRMEMHIALWRRPGDANLDIKRATAELAGLIYLREVKRISPTSVLPKELPKQTSSWWGTLSTEDED